MARVSEAVAAIKLGSIDFIEKPFRLEQMIVAIRRAIELDAERRNSSAKEESMAKRLDELTPRENEVMERIVRGAANKEVAAELGLSPKTIEVHRANIMRKTRAGSLAELVRLHVAVRDRVLQ
jgi:FixJ family two-component response regulator